MIMKFLILNLIINLTLVYGSKDPIVELENGKLLGVEQSNYYSFYAIPYAEPPIGDLRFESPKPYNEKWCNIRDAQNKPPACVQWDMFALDGDELTGAEDCLFLNVHTPDFETKELYPVVFYIHGGAFMFGNGNQETEKYLMRDPKMIYVTINYRLGQFGFLSTGDDQISGNMGLKDQHLALKWVKANIQKFGGDPNRVLMAGFSAGAASVEFQLLKPETENLAQAGISFSGSALNVWALCKNPEVHAIKLAKLLKCPTDSSKAMKNCFKKASAFDMMKQLPEFTNLLDISVGIFAPVVESKSVVDAFITESPRSLMSQGKVAKVPWMVSITAEDGALFTGRMYNLIEQDAPNKILHNFKQFEEKGKQYGDKFYENLISEVQLGNFKKVSDYFTYSVFEKEIVENLNLRRKNSRASTYAYIYDNAPDGNMANAFTNNMDHKFGTTHGDDMFLILQSELREMFPIRDDEKVISGKLIKMVESFIVKGKPIYGDVELPENKPGSDKIQYMKIKKDKVKIKTFKDKKVKTDKKLKIEL